MGFAMLLITKFSCKNSMYYTGKFSINEMCTTFPIVGSEVRNCTFPIPNFIPYCKIFLCYVYAPSHGFLALGKVFKVA